MSFDKKTTSKWESPGHYIALLKTCNKYGRDRTCVSELRAGLQRHRGHYQQMFNVVLCVDACRAGQPVRKSFTHSSLETGQRLERLFEREYIAASGRPVDPHFVIVF